MRDGALQGQIERHFFFRDHFGSLFLYHRALISRFVLNKHNLIQSHCSQPMRQNAKEQLLPLNEKNSENLVQSTQTQAHIGSASASPCFYSNSEVENRRNIISIFRPKKTHYTHAACCDRVCDCDCYCYSTSKPTHKYT